MKRINVSLDENVVERVDNFCKKKGVNRSALITIALDSYISAQEKLPELQSQLDELKKALDESMKIK